MTWGDRIALASLGAGILFGAFKLVSNHLRHLEDRLTDAITQVREEVRELREYVFDRRS